MAAVNARSASKAIWSLRVSLASLRVPLQAYFVLIVQQPSVIRPVTSIPCRTYASSSEPDLKTTLKEVIPAKRELLKRVKTHSGKVIGEVKVENTIGGMRYLISVQAW